MPGPSISICIPVRNGAQWLDATIDSALAQTREDFEILVVENASTDGTGDLVRRRSTEDSRIRLERFDRVVSAPANHNWAIRLARGALVKFLHQDDVLYPACLERMAAIFEAHPQVGFVFARRHILLEDPDDLEALEWARRYGTLDEGFTALGEVNRGKELLAQYLPTFGDSQYQNWIGEPSAVMVRRECFERVGAFSERLRQSWDLELWLRIFAVFDVGFVAEPLGAFRYHPRSLTTTNARIRADWLDLLWLYEGLLSEAALEPSHGMIRGFRRRQARRVLRRQLGRLRRGDLDLRPLGAYVAHRVRVGRRARSKPPSSQSPA
jgi:glycosyltransferase involved in cell wall biosynthesis